MTSKITHYKNAKGSFSAKITPPPSGGGDLGSVELTDSTGSKFLISDLGFMMLLIETARNDPEFRTMMRKVWAELAFEETSLFYKLIEKLKEKIDNKT